MKYIQINLHHSKAATAALWQRLAEGKADVALIQEPWLYKGQVRGLTNTGWTVYSVIPEGNVRSSICVRNHINALPLLEFCSRDTTTVRNSLLLRPTFHMTRTNRHLLKKWWTSLNTAKSGKSSSSLGVTQTRTTYCGGVLLLTQEENVSCEPCIGTGHWRVYLR
jgi:hypothetical protein